MASMATLITFLTVYSFSVLDVDSWNFLSSSDGTTTEMSHSASEVIMIGGKAVKFDKATASDGAQCDFQKVNQWCWVDSDQRQWIMDFLKEHLDNDEPQQLLKYTVRIKPETAPAGQKAGWEMFTKYVSKRNGTIIYGLFYFPWRPNDENPKEFSMETWPGGQRTDDDRPWP